MTKPDPIDPAEAVRHRPMDPLTAGLEYMVQRAHHRREKMIEEIQANRRGEYRVPTWVLGLILVAMIAAIVLALIFA